jgi:hypothetical protein
MEMPFIILLLGQRWKFVPKRFLSPPREFKKLYGNELRQTTLDNFFGISKNENVKVSKVEKKKKLIQLNIDAFFRK